MKLRLKVCFFAQVRREVGCREVEVEADATDTPRVILLPWREAIESVPHCRVAVDEEFHDWDAAVGDAREIAVIPPVSGG